MTKVPRVTFALFSLTLSLMCWLPVVAEGEESHHEHASEEQMRGQRLFYGLVEGKFESRACADCHNTIEIDTFNWNPNAWEIAHKYKMKSVEEFQKAVLNPTGATMSAMHSTFHLTTEEVGMIKLFLDDFEEEGLTKEKPVINKIFLFILLGVVLTWIILDIFFFKKVKRRYILGLLFVVALAWQIKLLYEAGTSLGRQQNYEPDQPVKFSHKVHAGDNQINCMYCHNTVSFSKSAGIPDVNVCWNCHSLVREGKHSGKHEITKIVEAYESKIPIEWVRVHNLQDHVFFSHAQHVGVARLECATCHGPIGEMDRVRQVSDLSMGWCINCHRDTEVQFIDNTFYDQYKELHSQLRSGDIQEVTAEMIGGTECSKCHY
jgi:hypothetical protein